MTPAQAHRREMYWLGYRHGIRLAAYKPDNEDWLKFEVRHARKQRVARRRSACRTTLIVNALRARGPKLVRLAREHNAAYEEV